MSDVIEIEMDSVHEIGSAYEKAMKKTRFLSMKPVLRVSLRCVRHQSYGHGYTAIFDYTESDE